MRNQEGDFNSVGNHSRTGGSANDALYKKNRRMIKLGLEILRK